MNKQTLAIIALTVSQIFWGMSYLMTKEALAVLPPTMLVTIRIFFAIIILGAIGFATGQIKPVKLKDYKYFLVAAICEPFAYFICEAEGTLRMEATIVSVVLSLIPLMVPVFAFLFLRERITLTNILGIVISLAGVVAIIWMRRSGDSGGENSIGGLVFLCCAVMASVTYTMMMRKIPESYNTITIVFYMFCTSMLFFVPTMLVRDWSSISTMSVDFTTHEIVRALGYVVALAVTASCVAFMFFSFGIRTIGATKANAFCNIQPVVSALFGPWFGEKAFEGWQIVALLVVVVGMFVSQIDFQALLAKKGERKI